MQKDPTCLRNLRCISSQRILGRNKGFQEYSHFWKKKKKRFPGILTSVPCETDKWHWNHQENHQCYERGDHAGCVASAVFCSGLRTFSSCWVKDHFHGYYLLETYSYVAKSGPQSTQHAQKKISRMYSSDIYRIFIVPMVGDWRNPKKPLRPRRK